MQFNAYYQKLDAGKMRRWQQNSWRGWCRKFLQVISSSIRWIMLHSKSASTLHYTTYLSPVYGSAWTWFIGSNFSVTVTSCLSVNSCIRSKTEEEEKANNLNGILKVEGMWTIYYRHLISFLTARHFLLFSFWPVDFDVKWWLRWQFSYDMHFSPSTNQICDYKYVCVCVYYVSNLNHIPFFRIPSIASPSSSSTSIHSIRSTYPPHCHLHVYPCLKSLAEQITEWIIKSPYLCSFIRNWYGIWMCGEANRPFVRYAFLPIP